MTNAAFQENFIEIDSGLATLSSLANETEAVVISLCDNNQPLYKKLLSMGIVRGTKVKLLTKSTLGGPLRISALGYQLSLRASEADCIFVNQTLANQL
jgi:ferrous iron transport protein A